MDSPPDFEQQVAAYFNADHNIKETSVKFNCHADKVRRILRDQGIDVAKVLKRRRLSLAVQREAAKLAGVKRGRPKVRTVGLTRPQVERMIADALASQFARGERAGPSVIDLAMREAPTDEELSMMRRKAAGQALATTYAIMKTLEATAENITRRMASGQNDAEDTNALTVLIDRGSEVLASVMKA